MQIPSSSISQYIGSTLNRNQQPVTIEGQIVEDNDRKKRARQLETNEQSSTNAPLATENPAIKPQLIKPVSAPGDISDSLLIQKKLTTASEQTKPTEQNFPYANRRSFNGLAGASLIIENYLNNEPSANSAKTIDFFI